MYTDMYNLQIVYSDSNTIKCKMIRAKLYECLDIINDISKNYTVERVNISIIIDNRKDK